MNFNVIQKNRKYFAATTDNTRMDKKLTVIPHQMHLNQMSTTTG
ncbi:hypothetical protein [Vibrio sp. EJY3]|nr:hypothetical protein [Vibrio sp. EJY3]